MWIGGIDVLMARPRHNRVNLVAQALVRGRLMVRRKKSTRGDADDDGTSCDVGGNARVDAELCLAGNFDLAPRHWRC